MMTNQYSSFIVRSVLGFSISPILPIIIYTWYSWGEAFFPMIYIVTFVAYLLTVIVLLPAYLVVLRKGFFNVYSSSALSFSILFVLFYLFFVSMGSGSNAITSGAKMLVVDGEMTAAGYMTVLRSAFYIGLFGMLGGFIFAVFIRGKNLFNLNCSNT